MLVFQNLLVALRGIHVLWILALVTAPISWAAPSQSLSPRHSSMLSRDHLDSHTDAGVPGDGDDDDDNDGDDSDSPQPPDYTRLDPRAWNELPSSNPKDYTQGSKKTVYTSATTKAYQWDVCEGQKSVEFSQRSPLLDDDWSILYKGTMYDGKYSNRKKVNSRPATIKQSTTFNIQDFKPVRILQGAVYQQSLSNTDAVVRVIDSFWASNLAFVVFENINTWKTLHDAQQRTIKLKLQQFKSLIKAVETMHNQGIANRNLKPRNLVLEDEGSDTVKIMNFDQATIEPKIVDEWKGAEDREKPFSAPEIDQNAGQYYTKPTDIWSLAMIGMRHLDFMDSETGLRNLAKNLGDGSKAKTLTQGDIYTQLASDVMRGKKPEEISLFSKGLCSPSKRATIQEFSRAFDAAFPM
ncbi:hypothetical protein NUU61_000930 [Penicillium alfredii]|uniref:Protein kinase domain-containing protein n=1 Tax=Penicillium alfredii TaxID=1506179 RepID=A0A9W9KRH4_9EURO|nr:uncharacterized protein NUU61_000930 [Penicillium alfredii]KAJ5115171.1 hypothetical protein NUU61_000930 [Penicillium alfredii]